MSGVKGKNTALELAVRRPLHKLGYRYRLHDKTLPGKPDLVLPRHKAVIFVNGCFWHHHTCKLFKWPSTRQDFWRSKILGNEIRDGRNLYRLKIDGWRVLIVWECAIKGQSAEVIDRVISTAASWLESDVEFCNISNADDDLSGIESSYLSYVAAGQRCADVRLTATELGKFVRNS